VEAVVAVLLAVITVLLVALLRGRRRGRPAEIADWTPSSERPSGSELVVANRKAPPALLGRETEAVDTYRVRDPEAPDRELLVEFVPASLAQLTDVAAEDSPDGPYTARNALDGIVSSLPAAGALLSAGRTMRVVGPPEALAGLAKGTLGIVTSGGKNLGLARDVGSGQFAAHLRFANAGVTPVAGALAVFKMMSVVTGQYYLHRIDGKLSSIEAGVDRIVRGQHSVAFGKIEAAAHLESLLPRCGQAGVRVGAVLGEVEGARCGD